MTNILYIHGAYSSPTTFQHLVGRLPEHRTAFARYDCLTRSVPEVVAGLRHDARDAFGDEPYSVVGHSLGGLVGVLLYRSGEPVERIFTMASPFGGSGVARLLQMVFFTTPLFRDINPVGSTIRSVLGTEIRIPMVSVVTTAGGSPVFPNASDGVVTVASQMSLPGPDYHVMPYNHFDVLVARPVEDLLVGTVFRPVRRR